MTVDEITAELTNDARPAGPDGCSNVDRIAFVMEVFKLDVIDLNLAYDFTKVIESRDEFHIMAAKHLALLKLDYLNRLYSHYLMQKRDYDSVSAPLILAVQRIEWHLYHVSRGLPTPPWSAFH